MTRFLHWRKMTWAIVFWIAATGLLMVGGGAVLLISLAFLLGIVSLSFVWFVSRPLWRQGHGARIRRLRAPPIRGPLPELRELLEPTLGIAPAHRQARRGE